MESLYRIWTYGTLRGRATIVLLGIAALAIALTTIFSFLLPYSG